MNSIGATMAIGCGLLAVVTDFSPNQIGSLGAAGIMGAMWLFERRNGAKRDRQIDEAHARIMEDRVKLQSLVDLVRDATDTNRKMLDMMHERPCLHEYPKGGKERSGR